MDKDTSRFVKKLLDMVMRSAMHATMFRLPLWMIIALGLAAAAAAYWFKLY